ncbi:MAG: hydroxyisourate hydrolase [Acidobacteriota bacterium]
MGAITTHVLDTARGRPGAGIAVLLERRDINRGEWKPVGHGNTDEDGRLRTLMPEGALLEPGQYQLIFDTRTYFNEQAVQTLYPSVIIVFEVAPGETHYHVPLLLAPFGYATYRGS